MAAYPFACEQRISRTGKPYRASSARVYPRTLKPTATQGGGTSGAQLLAGVVEDIGLTYDLVDGVNNPVEIAGPPYADQGITYTANQIWKVKLHVGVRSETTSSVR